MEIITDVTTLRIKNTNVKLTEINNIIPQANQMLKLMIENNGCGIASPQVGINKRFFLALLDNKVKLFINPTISNLNDEVSEDYEGCLSVPNMNGIVKRYINISIKHWSMNQRKYVTEIYEGFNARVLQHEYDHLEGILYIDKATSLEKREKTA